MKLFICALLTLLSALAFWSCGKKKPVACFALPQDRLEVGEQYAFKDCSIGAKEYQWSFGDGGTAALASPTYTYKEAGTYLISLKVTGKKGTDELKRQITAFNLDLTTFVIGEFLGSITETYPDSIILNRTYATTVTVTKLSNKTATLTFPRGAFDAPLAGTAENLTWNAVNEPRPERLTDMKDGSGSYIKNTDALKFTLTGTDPRFGNISWQIVFSGKRK
jgi:PKD repeat protein